MCKCRTVARFELENIKFELHYKCASQHLELVIDHGKGYALAHCFDVSGHINEMADADRDDLNEIIQGLDDKEVERLIGYLEGWRDSDDE